MNVYRIFCYLSTTLQCREWSATHICGKLKNVILSKIGIGLLKQVFYGYCPQIKIKIKWINKFLSHGEKLKGSWEFILHSWLGNNKYILHMILLWSVCPMEATSVLSCFQSSRYIASLSRTRQRVKLTAWCWQCSSNEVRTTCVVVCRAIIISLQELLFRNDLS